VPCPAGRRILGAGAGERGGRGGAGMGDGRRAGERRAVTRREALLWLLARLAAAAGAASAVGAAAALRPWVVGRRRDPAPAFGAPPAPDVERFRSRPDLRPPRVTVDVPSAPDADPGLVFTDAHFGPGQQGALVLDGRGEVVWFLPLSGPSAAVRAFNVRVQTYRGQPVITMWQGRVVAGHGEGEYVLYDSSYRQVARVSAQGGYRGDLHEFVLTERDTALLTCYGQAASDLSALGGPASGAYWYGVVQEVDVATGRLLFEWRSDEHVPLAESYLPPPSSGAPWDYFHVNSVCVDPTDGNLIVSGRNVWTVYKVHRTSGRVLWRLGGKASDFPLDGGARFAFQHHAVRWPDATLTVFDNEAGPPAEARESRALVLSLDERARTAALLRQYRHVPPVLSDALGSVQDLPRGHRFVGWGTSSYFTEYDASGRVRFDGRLAPGTESYRAFKQTWHGLPARPPDMAVEAGRDGVTVFASWNGATDVERWVVLGGESPARLRPVAAAPRAGFETAIRLTRPPSYAAVAAVGAGGRMLGRSAVRAVRP
jgi:hypothetical protein